MEYLRLLPSEFNNTLTPRRKLTPLEFIFPHRFPLQEGKSNLSRLGLFISPSFFYSLWWQIWHPSKVRLVPLICRKGSSGWAGDKLTAPFCCPSSGGFSKTALAWSRCCCLHGDKSLQLRQLYPAGSGCELTGFEKNKTLRENIPFHSSPHYSGWWKTTLIWCIGCWHK